MYGSLSIGATQAVVSFLNETTSIRLHLGQQVFVSLAPVSHTGSILQTTIAVELCNSGGRLGCICWFMSANCLLGSPSLDGVSLPLAIFNC